MFKTKCALDYSYKEECHELNLDHDIKINCKSYDSDNHLVYIQIDDKEVLVDGDDLIGMIKNCMNNGE